MAKHTPAPWYISEDTRGDDDTSIDIYTDAFGGCVATVINDYEHPFADEKPEVVEAHQPEVEANARLIAAAPELLRDLEEAAAIIKKHSYPCPDKPDTNWAKAEAFEETIKSATGGSDES